MASHKMNAAGMAALRSMLETKFKNGTLKTDRQIDLADQFFNISKIRISNGTMSHYLRKWGYPTNGRGRRPTKQLELPKSAVSTVGPPTLAVRLAGVLEELASIEKYKDMNITVSRNKEGGITILGTREVQSEIKLS